MQLSEDANWWQSGTAETEFEFEAPLHPETESALRGEVAGVLAFFYENYGLEPVDLLVTAVRDLSTGANAWVGEITVGGQVYNLPEPDFPIAHEYFHVLQFHWAQGPANFFELPNWLIEGTAVYAEDVYHRERLGWTGGGIRAHWWQRATGSSVESLPLGHWVFDHGWQGDEAVYVGYYVGALATDWLVRRAAALSTGTPFAPLEPPEMVAGPDHNAHLEFFRLLPASASWEEAFEAAFGIAVDDFYEAFEEYRRGAFFLSLRMCPMTAMSRSLELMGEIPALQSGRHPDGLRSPPEFFSDRLGAGPTDYTVYVAADGEAGISAYVNVFAEEPEEGGRVCNAQAPGIGVYVALGCYHLFAGNLATHHFYRVLTRLAPWHSVPVSSDAPTPWGPQWLQLAAIGYMTYAGQAAAGTHTIEQIRSGRATLAGSTTRPLSSLETAASVDTIASQVAEALSFLAADWLVQRAGEPSLFEYYRLLPSSGSWEDAFAAAFGIGVADFYEAFEAYRREAVTPLPHFADDSDDPVLVSIGRFRRR